MRLVWTSDPNLANERSGNRPGESHGIQNEQTATLTVAVDADGIGQLFPAPTSPYASDTTGRTTGQNLPSIADAFTRTIGCPTIVKTGLRKLLGALALKRGRILTHTEIASVLDTSRFKDPARTLRMYVSQLRRKIERYAWTIVSHREVGYRIAPTFDITPRICRHGLARPGDNDTPRFWGYLDSGKSQVPVEQDQRAIWIYDDTDTFNPDEIARDLNVNHVAVVPPSGAFTFLDDGRPLHRVDEIDLPLVLAHRYGVTLSSGNQTRILHRLLQHRGRLCERNELLSVLKSHDETVTQRDVLSVTLSKLQRVFDGRNGDLVVEKVPMLGAFARCKADPLFDFRPAHRHQANSSDPDATAGVRVRLPAKTILHRQTLEHHRIRLVMNAIDLCERAQLSAFRAGDIATIGTNANRACDEAIMDPPKSEREVDVLLPAEALYQARRIKKRYGQRFIEDAIQSALRLQADIQQTGT